jgi:hypothetical protein
MQLASLFQWSPDGHARSRVTRPRLDDAIQALAKRTPDGSVVMVMTEPIFYVPAMLPETGALNSFTVQVPAAARILAPLVAGMTLFYEQARFISDPAEICMLELPALGERVEIRAQSQYRVTTHVCCVVRLVEGSLVVTSSSGTHKWSMDTLFAPDAPPTSRTTSRRRVRAPQPQAPCPPADDTLIADVGDTTWDATYTALDCPSPLFASLLDWL